MITRKQYLAGEASYYDYYAQFVTDATVRTVAQAFGVDNLTKALAADRHLNTLPLARWDALTTAPTVPPTCPMCHQTQPGASERGGFRVILPFNREVRALADAYPMTRADAVCIAKVAAVIAVNRSQES